MLQPLPAPAPHADRLATSRPTVSVIMPAFNTETYVAQAIESALGQTYPDFELIVVDDGSSDRTAAIAASYVQQDSRIRLLRQRNMGIAPARNAAVAQSRGQFFALLDSDDVWLPDYLSEQLDILATWPDIGVLSANALNLGGVFDGQPLLPVEKRSRVRRVPLLRMIEAEASICILSMIRREVVDALRGFDETLARSEDYDFWLRAAESGFAVAVNPKPLALYRRREGSASADEGRMLEAIAVPLTRLRQRSAEKPDVLLAIDRQLERLARRRLVANAKSALLEGNMGDLAAQFSALADETGGTRYRIASWLTAKAPRTIRWAYWCKTRFGQLTRRRPRPAARLLEHV